MVADAKMVEYHGQPNVESYVLTIMNMVRLLRAVRGGRRGLPGDGGVEVQRVGVPQAPSRRYKLPAPKSRRGWEAPQGVTRREPGQRWGLWGCCEDTTECHSTPLAQQPPPPARTRAGGGEAEGARRLVDPSTPL